LNPIVATTRDAIEQFNGREGETATLFGRCPLSLTLSLAVLPHVISAVRLLRVVSRQVWKMRLLNLLFFPSTTRLGHYRISKRIISRCRE